MLHRQSHRHAEGKEDSSDSVGMVRSNENKMSDGGRERAPLGVEMWKSSQNVDAERSAVRSIAWLDVKASIGDNTLPKRPRDQEQ